jgi:hypothetical protein
MNFFEGITSNVTKAVDFVVEKNRKAAIINRIRIVIKNERENEARAYVALGKYYYEHLRDPQNEETEHLCRAVDFSDRRMKKAFAKLDEITAPEGCEEDSCTDCADDCDYCPYYDEADEPQRGSDSDEITGETAPSASDLVSRANEEPDPAASTDGTDEVPEEAADDEPFFRNF